MLDNFNETLISLITLNIFIVALFSWLISRTLKEGRKALTEMNKDKS